MYRYSIGTESRLEDADQTCSKSVHASSLCLSALSHSLVAFIPSAEVNPTLDYRDIPFNTANPIWGEHFIVGWGWGFRDLLPPYANHGSVHQPPEKTERERERFI